ncbi:MAG: hypothetical protein JRN48_05865 [Nitrososphaerota archaeon]|nr:hypothetical protein [Nitrososphaerota archaeon]
MATGSMALLAKRRGRLRRLMMAIWVCQSLDLRASMTNSEESPKDIRNSNTNDPPMVSTLK